MKTEFAELIDILIARGFRHSQILEKMQEAVGNALLIQFPRVNLTACNILIDEQTGQVQISSRGKIVTPKNFAPIAERTAIQTLIQLLKSSEGTKQIRSVQADDSVSSKLAQDIGQGLSALFFWIYNGIYLVLAGIFVLNFLINANYRQDFFELFSRLNAFRSVSLVALCLTPLFSILAALKSTQIKTTKNYSKLLFFFEIPLLTLLFVAFTSFAQTAPWLWFFELMLIFLLMALFLDLIKFRPQSLVSAIGILTLQQSSFLTAAYLVMLYSFYFFPFVGSIVKGIMYALSNIFFSGHDYSFNIIAAFLSLIAGGIGVFGIAILIIAPYVIVYLIWLQLAATHLNLKSAWGEKLTWQIHATLAVIFLILFAACSYQPDISPYIDRLNALPTASNFEEKEKVARELLPHEAEIKRGIEDALNAHSRYPFRKEDTSLKYGYEGVLGLDETVAGIIQDSFLTLAYPFVYQGKTNDSNTLTQNYVYLFGKSWQETQYPVTPAQNVKLVSRKINAQKSADNLFAKIEVTDEFSNTNFGNQEVIYEFALPQGSTVINLKLGPDLEFPGIFSPKGAAAKVYTQELNRSRDPALLEQTGPRQYRLRVFPIPAKQDWQAATNQKIQFTYVTSLAKEGFLEPVYSKKQNLDDANARITSNLDEINASVTAAKNDLCRFKDSAFADFACTQTDGIKTVNSLSAKKIAILLDVSYANRANQFVTELKKTLAENPDFAKNNDLILFNFNDSLSQPKPLTSATINQQTEAVYFGKTDLQQVFQDFKTKYYSGERSDYDLVLVLTSSEWQPIASQDLFPSAVFNQPFYFVHDKIIPAYPSGLTDFLYKTESEASTSLTEALNLYALAQAGKTKNISPLNAYLAINTGNAIEKRDELISYLANYKKIMMQATTQSRDEIHALAKQSGVVGPFTSLIALVNETQIQNLEEFSKEQDKFSFEGQLTESQFSPQPVDISINSGGSGLFGLGGFKTTNLSLPSAGGGDLAISKPEAFAIQSLPSAIPALFILANVILVGFGGIFLVVGKLRKKRA